MRTARPGIPALLFLLCLAIPAKAVRSPTGTNLEEINQHQVGASAALLLGDHMLLKPGRYGVSGHVFLSGWGSDSLYGAWGLSAQAGFGPNLSAGFSYGFTDAQLHTQYWLLNFRYSPLAGPDPWLNLQAAAGHQFLNASDSGNVLIFQFDDPWPVQPDNPQILLDDMNWTHGYLNVLASPLFWRFRPQVSLGYVFSHYAWAGHQVIQAFGGPETGPALSDSGDIGTWIWTLGLGLDLGPVRPFVGMESFESSGLFLARMTIVF